MSEVQEFKIKDIKPSPFRHLDRYPINREKVEALKESLRATGYWDNLLARKINGSPELAYGHHRLIALEEEYGPDHKISLIIQDLSNEAMLKIMAGENREEWSHDVSVEHETVRAVVEALGQGDIELPAPNKKTPRNVIRYAPSFIRGADVPRAHGEHPYSAETIADFLGWREPKGRPNAKLQYALDALELMEKEILSQRYFTDLTTKQAEAVVTETNKALVRHQDDSPEEWGAKVGGGVAEALKGGAGVSSKDHIARKIDPRNEPEDEEPAEEKEYEHEKPSHAETLRLGFLIRAGEALRYAVYEGPVDAEMVAWSDNTAKAWADLTTKLKGMKVVEHDNGAKTVRDSPGMSIAERTEKLGASR